MTDLERMELALCRVIDRIRPSLAHTNTMDVFQILLIEIRKMNTESKSNGQ